MISWFTKFQRKGYENDNKMLFLVRTEIVKLIKAVRGSLKGQVSLPQVSTTEQGYT